MSIDLSRYQFSVIYSVDVPTGTRLNELTPPDYQRLWECTERGPSEDFDLGRDWRPGRHRKHCAILTFKQFCKFIEYVNLYVEKCWTMGSIGAPGFGFGLAPAVPFQSDHPAAIQSAYVTPVPPEVHLEHPAHLTFPEMPKDVVMPDWDDVERAMWEWFEDGVYSAEAMAEKFCCAI